MRTLSSFLAGQARPAANELYAVSDRFVNPETGKPEEFEIKCITSDEYARLRKGCIRMVPSPGGKKGLFTQELDTGMFQSKLICACTVWPDLNAVELQQSYGPTVMSAEQLIARMLTPGEMEDYFTRVLEVNGFRDKSELVEEAKN